MKQGPATSPFRQETASQKTGSAGEANNPTTNPGFVQHDRQSARPPQSVSSTSTVEAPKKQSFPDESRIRQRAYQLYVESGYRDGHAEEHWLMAEREISEKES